VNKRPSKAGGREAFGKWVDKKAYRGLPACKRVYCIGVVQYSAPILCRRRGDAEIDVGVVIRAG